MKYIQNDWTVPCECLAHERMVPLGLFIFSNTLGSPSCFPIPRALYFYFCKPFQCWSLYTGRWDSQHPAFQPPPNKQQYKCHAMQVQSFDLGDAWSKSVDLDAWPSLAGCKNQHRSTTGPIVLCPTYSVCLCPQSPVIDQCEKDNFELVSSSQGVHLWFAPHRDKDRSPSLLSRSQGEKDNSRIRRFHFYLINSNPVVP